MVAVTPAGSPSAVKSTVPVNDWLLVRVRPSDPAAPPVVSVSVPGETPRLIVAGGGAGITVISVLACFFVSTVDVAVIVTGPTATPVTSAVVGPVDVTVARLASDVLHVTSVFGGGLPSTFTFATNCSFAPT